MATTASFDSLLKRYMPYDLLQEEMKRRNYFWSKVEKDEDWNGGTLDIPLETGEASSLSFGALTSSTDIAEAQHILGYISSQPELWGTMIFNEKDLDRHGDLTKSFLKIVPDKIDQFMDRMSERVSISLLGSGAIAKATANGDASGNITVDNPELFTLGEKVEVIDDNTALVSGYVRAVNVNSGVLLIYDARTGGAVVDLSAYTTAQNAKVRLPGQASGFTSLKSILAPTAAGGSAQIYNTGVNKDTVPMLQAVAIDGSGFTAATILNDLLGAYYQILKVAKGSLDKEMIIPYGMFKNMAKLLETNRQYVTADKKAGYGFMSVKLLGPDGEATITAIRGISTSEVFVVDWKALKFHGSKFFERKRHMDNKESFLVRNTTGYQYIVDMKFYGDLVVSKPSHCGCIYSIPASCSA